MSFLAFSINWVVELDLGSPNKKAEIFQLPYAILLGYFEARDQV